ncbi:uncharacterized protein LOC142642364 [Castanea sativa]|uniref:uncharacterized protein LOC142642364 n=1 Tax=Castanea sativa TaxID=21020 RepID=UPI003F652D9E
MTLTHIQIKVINSKEKKKYFSLRSYPSFPSSFEEKREEEIMEGLIPFLLHAIRKPRPHNSYNRSQSENSTRSYHLLNAAESVSGSSHRRTRSEIQPPTIEFVQQRPGNEYNHSSTVHKRSTSSSSVGSYPSQVPNKATNFTNIHC